MAEQTVPSFGTPETIIVHGRVLGHLSRGLYRSPASALRELISNAWDANASEVRIDTGFPRFDVVTIEDDGDGFELASFLAYMRGEIGNSTKRTHNSGPNSTRPVLGRLGIGLLGIAQICGGFRIASKTLSGSQFQARVDLQGRIRQRIDEPNSPLKLEQVNPDDWSYGIGTFTLEEPAIVLARSGTVIIADDPYPSFTSALKSSVTENFTSMPRDWRAWIEEIQKHRNVQELGHYWKLIFDLSSTCPVPYLNDSALPNNLAAETNEKFKNYAFNVVVDSRKLYKPILFDSNEIDAYAVTEIESEDPNGRGPRVHGYLIGKNGNQIKPAELRGVLIRIKEVGVGLYDRTFLDYRENEGPRLNWVTGEIFVEEGMEDALNIDRDSFNRFHPDYISISRRLHVAIQSHLMPELNKKQAKRSEERQRIREANRVELVSKVVPNRLGEKQDDEQRGIKSQVRKVNQSLADAMSAIYDSAQSQPSADLAREKFLELLKSLLRDWE